MNVQLLSFLAQMHHSFHFKYSPHRFHLIITAIIELIKPYFQFLKVSTWLPPPTILTPSTPDSPAHLNVTQQHVFQLLTWLSNTEAVSFFQIIHLLTQSGALWGKITLFVRDAFQKKNSIWRDIVPTSHYPLPPFKSRDKNRSDIFWVLDPPPPL